MKLGLLLVCFFIVSFEQVIAQTDKFYIPYKDTSIHKYVLYDMTSKSFDKECSDNLQVFSGKDKGFLCLSDSNKSVLLNEQGQVLYEGTYLFQDFFEHKNLGVCAIVKLADKKFSIFSIEKKGLISEVVESEICRVFNSDLIFWVDNARSAIVYKSLSDNKQMFLNVRDSIIEINSVVENEDTFFYYVSQNGKYGLFKTGTNRILYSGSNNYFLKLSSNGVLIKSDDGKLKVITLRTGKLKRIRYDGVYPITGDSMRFMGLRKGRMCVINSLLYIEPFPKGFKNIFFDGALYYLESNDGWRIYSSRTNIIEDVKTYEKMFRFGGVLFGSKSDSLEVISKNRMENRKFPGLYVAMSDSFIVTKYLNKYFLSGRKSGILYGKYDHFVFPLNDKMGILGYKSAEGYWGVMRITGDPITKAKYALIGVVLKEFISVITGGQNGESILIDLNGREFIRM